MKHNPTNPFYSPDCLSLYLTLWQISVDLYARHMNITIFISFIFTLSLEAYDTIAIAECLMLITNYMKHLFIHYTTDIHPVGDIPTLFTVSYLVTIYSLLNFCMLALVIHYYSHL